MEEQLIGGTRQHTYQEIVEMAPILICRFLPYSTITLANRAYCEYFGMTKDEVIGRSFLDFIPEKDRDGISELYRGLSIQTPTITYERRAITTAGVRWLKWTGQAIFDSQGAIIAYQSIGEDITERKNSEDARMQSQARLSQLIDFLPDATFAIDIQGKVIMWNKAMEDLTQVTAQEMLGRGNYEYALPFYGTRRPVLINLALEQDRTIEKFYTYVDRRGDMLYGETFLENSNKFVWVKSSPIRDTTGIIFGAIESVRDITGWKNAESELKASEKRYRDIFENVSDFLYVHDLNGRIIETNLAVKHEYGYTKEDFTTYTIRDLIPDRFRDQFEDYLERVIQNGKDEGIMHIQTKDNEIRIIEYKNSLVCDAHGTAIAVRGSAHDITEREKTLAALRESEERYRLLEESAHAMIWSLDVDTLRYAYLSPSIKNLLGYTVEEAMSLPPDTFFHPETFHAFVSALKTKISYERGDSHVDPQWQDIYEVEQIRKDGSKIWTILYATFLRDKNSRPTHILGVTRDITTRKHAESALKESEERFRQMAEAIPVVFWMVSPDRTRVIYVSPAYEKICGYTCETLYVLPSLWFEIIHPEDREQVKNLASAQKDKVMDYEYRIVRPDGSIRWIHDKTSPILDEKGKIILLTGIMEDITDKKKSEEERRLYEARLNRAQKMEAIGTLAGGIAHDFNNILSSIIGYTELSLDDAPKATLLYTYLEEVLRAGDRARDLVRQILMFSRQADMERRPVRLDLIIKEALKLLRSSIPSTIRIDQDIENTTDCVYADPTQIHQVIMNLCTNAYQSMIDTGGVLLVSLKHADISEGFSASQPHLGEGPHLKLSVCDTGCGMESSMLERIFDPFFTTRGKGSGTGLGLSTVHGIVMELGGAVIVSSTPGKGSTFEVYLPRCERDIHDTSRPGPDIPGGNGETILFVDDEVAILHVGKTILEQLGYEVNTASSGAEALKLFISDPGRYDLVITDQFMPNMTGAQLASEMFRIRPELPVILITGYSETVSEESSTAHGISCCIEKPFSRNTIGEAVFKTLHDE